MESQSKEDKEQRSTPIYYVRIQPDISFKLVV